MSWKNCILNIFGFKVKYNNNFFNDDWFNNWDLLKYVLKELIESKCHWKRILDFGCGPGVMIDLMNDAGYDYYGFDTSMDAHKLYLNNFGKYPEKYLIDINKIKHSEWDLCLSFDVLEHMADEQVIDVFSKMGNFSELLLNISRQKGIPGHINIKNDNEWQQFFESIGYHIDKNQTKEIHDHYLQIRPDGPDLWHKNIFLFSRNYDE